MYEERLDPQMKQKYSGESSPGRRIFEMLEDYSPQVQRQALNEAEKLIHERFDQRLCQIKEEAESISKQWEIFKGNG